jgi:hypothetical protein
MYRDLRDKTKEFGFTNHARKPRPLGGEEWHPC